MTPRRPAPESGRRASADAFRPDIEGLRGIAVLLVVAFHAGLPATSGGFVGVDVFFVISGFLITGLLLEERAATGRIDLVRFYARRARRIVPAAAATLVGTLALCVVMVAPLDLPRIAEDAAAVVLFGGNIRFAADASDYFAAAAAPSPFLQYWSLGVEEQFYLVWPALMIVACRARVARAQVAVVLVLGASLATALAVTGTSVQSAFYLLPARAWQFAAGGLVAVTANAHAHLPDRTRAAAGWGGLAAIGVALLAFGPDTPYPGTAALLPTAGAAAILLAGNARRSPTAVLTLEPVRFVGRISYSLYLVHWPLLTLPAAGLALGTELPLAQRIVLAVVSIPIAWASYRWVEQPFRHGRFVMPARRVLATAGATAALLLAVILAVDVGASVVVDSVNGDSVAAGSVAGSMDASAAGSSNAAMGYNGDATSGEDGVGALDAPPPDLLPEIDAIAMARGTAAPSATASARPIAIASPGPTRLPAGVRPALARARDDLEPLLHDGCEVGYAGTAPPNCVYGDRKASRTVALVGDSHAAQWFPALEALATQDHWRLVPFVKLSCRFFDLPMLSQVLKREYTECAAWRNRVVDRLQALEADLVIVAVARGPQMLTRTENDPRVQGNALARLLKRIPSPAAIVVDTPQSYYDVPACVSANARDVRRCETPRRAAFGWRYRILERTAAKASGATLVDLSSATCPADPCPVVINGMLVYRDSHHLTATFAASLAPRLQAALPALDAPAAQLTMRQPQLAGPPHRDAVERPVGTNRVMRATLL